MPSGSGESADSQVSETLRYRVMAASYSDDDDSGDDSYESGYNDRNADSDQEEEEQQRQEQQEKHIPTPNAAAELPMFHKVARTCDRGPPFSIICKVMVSSWKKRKVLIRVEGANPRANAVVCGVHEAPSLHPQYYKNSFALINLCTQARQTLRTAAGEPLPEPFDQSLLRDLTAEQVDLCFSGEITDELELKVKVKVQECCPEGTRRALDRDVVDMSAIGKAMQDYIWYLLTTMTESRFDTFGGDDESGDESNLDQEGGGGGEEKEEEEKKKKKNKKKNKNRKKGP